MEIFVVPYPVIDPVAVQIGPFPLRWYALAYIGGLGLGWIYARLLVSNDRLWGDTLRPSAKSISDLVLYVAIGVVVGGRLGDVLFYDPSYFFQHPLEIAQLWNGGMAFHGGLIGAFLAIWYFAREAKVPFFTIADIGAAAAPIGIFLVRIANFIKPELWGRPGKSTDAAKPQAVADSSVHADPTAVVAPLQSTNKSNPPPGNIMAAQNRLIELRFLKGPADGVWGAKSRTALRAFKVANGLTADDKWDDLVSGRLYSTQAPRSPLPLATTGR